MAKLIFADRFQCNGMNQSNRFKQTNAFAMQYGLLLGAWGIISLCVMGLSLRLPSLSFIAMLMSVGSPVIAVMLTSRFRKASATAEEGFSFGKGFLFAFMTGIYASIWVAVFVYVYMAYLDGGYFFNAYEAMVRQPEYAAQLEESGIMASLEPAGGLEAVIDAMRAIPPANYAGMVIYLTVLTSPVVSALVALVCRRRPAQW